jgi:hypothetical protein
LLSFELSFELSLELSFELLLRESRSLESFNK